MTRHLLRVLGLLLGTLFIAVAIGAHFDGYTDGHDSLLVDASMIIMGLYFVLYGVTGRSTILEVIWKEKRKSARES